MTAPIAAGYIPLGIAYGILVMQLGMPWWMAPALSLAAYSGSAELLVITLAASHTPIAVIAVTMLLVNFRHLFYAFSFPLHIVEGKLARLFSMYALVDEAYAITAARPEGWTKPRLLAMQVTYNATWVASGLIGVLAFPQGHSLGCFGSWIIPHRNAGLATTAAFARTAAIRRIPCGASHVCSKK